MGNSNFVSSAVTVCLLATLCFVQYVSAGGIVGFGISLYQDLCCQSCHDSLSSLYLNCTTFEEMAMKKRDMDMMMMGTTSEECYASNTPWLQTMAYCIQQNCDADGYSTEKQAKCFANQALKGASEPTFQDSLPATAPTVELADDAEWLNETSLVNADLYYSIHGTLAEFARSEYIHTRYAVMLYLIVIGVCIICGFFAQTRSAYPGFQKRLQASNLWAKLQQYIFLPALFGSRRLEALPGKLGYIPSRALSISIGIYVILNIILSSVSFRNFWPNTWFVAPSFEMCEYVGNRTGTLSLVNMSIAILFAGRNNILIALTGWNQTAFLTLHRWAARVATLQAVVHSIAYTISYFEPGATPYATVAAEPFYWWGIIATIALCLATAFAILPFRTKLYEIFLILHVALVILALVGCWYHLVPHFGYVYGYQVWLYICFAFWSADRVARVVRVAWYNRLGRSDAIVEALPGCDIMQVTIFPKVAWNFGPGQHSYLYIPALGNFLENHPFSVAGWHVQGQSPTHSASVSFSDSQTKDEDVKGSGVVSTAREQHAPISVSETQDRTSIKFLIRAHKGMTSNLHRRILSSPSHSTTGISVYIEGPYAGHHATLQPLSVADTVLCIIGGIGITHALGFLQEYMQSRSHNGGENPGNNRGVMRYAKRFILAWSARELALIEHVNSAFLVQNDDAKRIECSFWCTGQLDSVVEETRKGKELTAKVTPGRMDIGMVIRSAAEKGQQMTVLTCGPGGMADEVTRQVVGCVKEGFRVDLVEEAYAW